MQGDMNYFISQFSFGDDQGRGAALRRYLHERDGAGAGLIDKTRAAVLADGRPSDKALAC